MKKTNCILLAGLLFLSAPALFAKSSEPAYDSSLSEEVSDHLVTKRSRSNQQQPTENITAHAPPPKGADKNICDSWKPYILMNKKFQRTPKYFTSVSLGVGFLYFADQKGSAATSNEPNIVKTNKPKYIGGTGYNRTPLVDATIGWNPLQWMGVGMAYIGQHNIIFERNYLSKSLINTNPAGTFTSPGYFRANVDLNAVVAKAYFYLPYSMIWKTIAYSPFAAFGVGPAWQSWTPRFDRVSINTNEPTFVVRQKISANCFFMADVGCQLRSVIPNLNFSVNWGVKFNIWGQARSMGKASQQRIRKGSAGPSGPLGDVIFLNQPWSIKTVYQFAPYIGIMLSF